MAYARGLTEIDGNFKTEARLVAADVVIDSLVHIDGVPFNVDVADGGEGIPLNNGLFANPVLTSPFTIRESFLDNPLVHLYTKNDLVRVLAGSSELASDRNTIATRVDINGIVRDVDIDDPREETTGWLFEGESENLFLHSDEFDDAPWSKGSSTIVTNDTTAPDGTATADRFEASSTATIIPLISQSVISSAGNQFTISIFVKPSEVSFIQITFGNGEVINDPRANFDLATKTAGSVDSDIDDISITEAANGFVRISVTVTTVGLSLGTRFNLIKTASDARFKTNSWIAGDGLFIWRAKVEELPFVSSGIKTVATTETRSADDQSFPSAENFRESEGAIFLRADVIGDTGASQVIFEVGDGTSSNRLLLFRSSNKIRLQISSSGSSQVDISTEFNMDVGTQYEIAVNYAENDVELFVDGVSIGTDNSAIMPIGPSIVVAGNTAVGTSPLFGHIQDLRFYPENLTISEIKHLGSN